MLESNGFLEDDPRIMSINETLSQYENLNRDITVLELKKINHLNLLRKILDKHLVIQDHSHFKAQVQDIFNSVKNDESLDQSKGFIPDYIPALLDVKDQDSFAVSICTVDGQMVNLGDYDEKACMHSICSVISYLIALQDLGEDDLKNYIGSEPSGVEYNALELIEDGRAHNPLN